MQFTLEQIRQALQIPNFNAIHAQNQMAPGPRPRVRPPDMPGHPRLGAVLLLLYCRQQQMNIVLTKRPDTLKNHPGQVSFPGGRKEEGESYLQAALREAWEEIGVLPEPIKVLGKMEQIYIIPTDFQVQPYVGWYEGEPQFQANEDEVAEIIEVPLQTLFQPYVRQQDWWDMQGTKVLIPYFQLNRHRVWGATAVMLSEFVARLETVQPVRN